MPCFTELVSDVTRNCFIEPLFSVFFPLPRNQLVEQMRHVRDEKRRLRRAIRDMEADVLRQHSAVPMRFNGTGADDSGDALEPVYAQYRHARAKLRLLEALVAKHDGSATL